MRIIVQRGTRHVEQLKMRKRKINTKTCESERRADGPNYVIAVWTPVCPSIKHVTVRGPSKGTKRKKQISKSIDSRSCDRIVDHQNEQCTCLWRCPGRPKCQWRLSKSYAPTFRMLPERLRNEWARSRERDVNSRHCEWTGWQKLICGMADPADRRMCTTVETA